MRLIPQNKSVILLWQHNNTWSTTIPPLKLRSICNPILFHSVASKTDTLSKAITYLFSIQAYFAPKWNKTRLMISITLTLLAVYSACSLGEGAALHKSWWWRTFTRRMIQWRGLAACAGSSEGGTELLFVSEPSYCSTWKQHCWFIRPLSFTGLRMGYLCSGRMSSWNFRMSRMSLKSKQQRLNKWDKTHSTSK